MTVSVATIQFKFPEFSSLPPEQIGLAIEEAQLVVDDSWPSNYQDLGTAYYAAHLLMVQVSRLESATGQLVKSENIGPMTITYDTQARVQQTDVSLLDNTPYGARFLELVEMLFPTATVI